MVVRGTKRTLHSLAIYVAVGGFVFLLEAGLFMLFMRITTLAFAAVFSYVCGACVHFVLNRGLNFRNFERPIQGQALTYAVVASGCCVISLGIVEGGVRLLHMAPVIAKVLATASNVPIGFLGHRYLTFSGGIRAALSRLRSSC